jgi:cation:H+ antiporter
MSTAALLLEFLLALAIVSGAGYLLTVLLGRLGATLRLTPAALGLAVAFGADSPELGSSVSSLIHGHGEVGVGVVLGSNVFNIAVVLGVGALVAERPIKVGRAAAWFSGGAFLLSLLPGGALLLGWSSPALALVLVSLVFVPYAALCSMRPAWLDRWLPGWARGFVREAMSKVESEEDSAAPRAPKLSWGGGVGLLVALGAVVAGSLWMVGRAILLAERWQLSGALLGAFLLAGLTGVPNLVAAVRLARRGRGGAALSEALNSNTLNVLFGLCLPALFAASGPPGKVALIGLGWLPPVTLLALVLAGRPAGLGRNGGACLLLAYAAFALTAWLGAA